VVVLAVVAALIGVGFKNVLYGTEDLCDRLWKNRPEWARPAVAAWLSDCCCWHCRRCTASATR